MWNCRVNFFNSWIWLKGWGPVFNLARVLTFIFGKSFCCQCQTNMVLGGTGTMGLLCVKNIIIQFICLLLRTISKAHELVQQASHERVSKITKCKKLVNVCLFINKSNLNFTLDLFIKHVEPKNNKKVVHKKACEHRAWCKTSQA